MLQIASQLFCLIVLPLLIACVVRTVVYEELFREIMDYFKRGQSSKSIVVRKLSYLFTCDYCLSHWVTLLVFCFAQFRLLVNSWHGLVIAYFATVFVANIYLSVYALLKLETTAIKEELEE